MAECAFCGADRKLTGEHAPWPAWLVKLVPPLDPAAPLMRTQGTYKSIAEMVEMPAAPQGPQGAKRVVNMVCKPCNEGWMSGIEGRARPILEPLILDRPVQPISHEDQALIALWATLRSVVIEYTALDGLRASTADQRRFLYKAQMIPLRTRVWIGSLEPQTVELGFAHRTNGLASRQDAANARAGGHRIMPSVQQTTMVMGHLVLVVTTSALKIPLRVNLAQFQDRLTLVPAASEMSWPAGEPLMPNEMEVVAALTTVNLLAQFPNRDFFDA
jgi:hypothetical protein